MNILESYNENIFMEDPLEEDESNLKESYNYEPTNNIKKNNSYSEILGVDYGKDYYKAKEEISEEAYKEGYEDSYKLIKYEEDIYTNLVELDNDKEIIKYIKRASCIPVIDNTKIININLPDDTKEKKCIVQGSFLFKLEHYINDNRDAVYESKFILPFSKMIAMSMNTSKGIKVSVKLENYYLKAISPYSLILSATALFSIYDKDKRYSI